MTAKPATNDYFYLQCILGLMASAVLAAGVYAAVSASMTTTATAASSMLLATHTIAASAVLFSPVFPIVMLLLLIGSITLLPLLLCGDSHISILPASPRCYTHCNRHTVFVDPCIRTHHHGHTGPTIFVDTSTHGHGHCH